MVKQATLDNLFEKMENEELKQLNIIVKTDVQGTAEAMKTSLEKLSNEEVRVKVIHSNAGGVTESDVQLAKAAKVFFAVFLWQCNYICEFLQSKKKGGLLRSFILIAWRFI